MSSNVSFSVHDTGRNVDDKIYRSPAVTSYNAFSWIWHGADKLKHVAPEVLVSFFIYGPASNFQVLCESFLQWFPGCFSFLRDTFFHWRGPFRFSMFFTPWVAVLPPPVVRWDRIIGLESCWISFMLCPAHRFLYCHQPKCLKSSSHALNRKNFCSLLRISSPTLQFISAEYGDHSLLLDDILT